MWLHGSKSFSVFGAKLRTAAVKNIVIALLTVLMISFGSLAFALSDTAAHDVTMQVTEIALLGLNNATAITLTTDSLTINAGENPIGDTDTSKLLQYTSLVPSTTSRNISVQWGGTDAAPAGTSLKLEATSAPGGASAGQVTLSSVGQSLITGIGSIATGTGANGAALTFTFSVDTVGSLVVGDNQTVTITYTLTDAA